MDGQKTRRDTRTYGTLANPYTHFTNETRAVMYLEQFSSKYIIIHELLF